MVYKRNLSLVVVYSDVKVPFVFFPCFVAIREDSFTCYK